jgi:hypothetical protein
MTVPILWLSYHDETSGRGFWDESLLESLFAGDLWTPVSAHQFNHYESWDALPEGTTTAVVVLPGRSQTDMVDQLNADLKRLDGVLLIICGDEESLFPVEQLDHPNLKLWVQTPRPGRHDDAYGFGCGWTPGTREAAGDGTKPVDWMFAGQVTHIRREECVEQLERMLGGDLVKTSGFTQGLEHDQYLKRMAQAKVVPCPSGPQTPDTFRLYEALELGCVPIADDRTPNPDYPNGYWSYLFRRRPLPGDLRLVEPPRSDGADTR